MSLFVQSMIMHGWQLTEENSKLIRFEHGDSESKLSVAIHRPLSRPVMATIRQEGFPEHSCEFPNLPALAQFVIKPNRLRQWFEERVPQDLP